MTAAARLTIRAEAVRRLRDLWEGKPSTEQMARQDFARLLLRSEIEALRAPSLPRMLSCTAEVSPEMFTTWKLRRDLQEAFDLASVDGYFGLVVWFARDGVREDLSLRQHLWDALPTLAAPWPAGGGESLLSQFNCALWLSRPDLQAEFAITSAAGRSAFAEWYLTYGVTELRSWYLLSEQQANWLQDVEPAVRQGPVPATHLMLRLWASRPDLRQAIPLNDPQWAAKLWVWLFEAGAVEEMLTPALLIGCLDVLKRWNVEVTAV